MEKVIVAEMLCMIGARLSQICVLFKIEQEESAEF